MAVMPMQRVTVCGLNSDRKAILEALQRLGTVEVKNSAPDDFIRQDTSPTRAVFAKSVAVCDNALKLLDKHSPESSGLFASFTGRNPIKADLYYTYIAESDEIMRVAKRIIELSNENEQLSAELVRCSQQIEALEPWMTLDVPLCAKGTKRTAVFVGSFPREMTVNSVLCGVSQYISEQGLEPDDYPVEVEIVSKGTMQTCVFAVCHSSCANDIENALRSIGFVKASVTYTTEPSLSKASIEDKIEKTELKIKANDDEIASYRGMRHAIRFIYDYYSMRIEKYEVLSEVSQKKHCFVIEGYCTAADAPKTEKVLSEKYNAFVEIEPVPEDDDPPVKLKNNFFASGAEPVLESYSLPNKKEIDPSGILAFFYYMLFGLMLTDAAYGVIIAAICGGLLLKYKNMEEPMKKTFTMFFWCGVSTIIWGIAFGGFFGDVIDIVANSFFHSDFRLKPLLFSPLNEPMKMMFFSLGVGVLHIFTGLGIAFYQKIKNADITSAIFDVGCWYLLIGGLILAFVTTPMFAEMVGLSESFAPFLSTPAIIAAAVGAVGIVLMSGRPTKNPLKRILKGLYELYGVTSYLSDILSYSRLLALGLATGVVASVFNQMGTMAGSGPVGIILFIFSFVAGNTLNLGINFLGAYVHTNRLQYVEFFGKFFEGGGRKFKPFSQNTKHYKITEEINNG